MPEIWIIQQNWNHLQCTIKLVVWCKLMCLLEHVELASWLGLSVHTKHNCENSWRNWKLLCLLQTFSQVVEIFETVTEGRTGISFWIKQSHRSNISIESTHLKEKSLHVTACLGVDNISASDGWIYRFKSQHCCSHCYCVQTCIF